MMKTISPVSAASCAIGAVHPLSRVGSALQLGGCFWATFAGCRLVSGVWRWETSQGLGLPFAILEATLLMAAVWATANAVINLADFLVRWSTGATLERSETLSRLAMWTAGPASIFGLFAVLSVLAFQDGISIWNPAGAIGANLAALMLGFAIWRSDSLPAPFGRNFILAGAAPLPFLILMAIWPSEVLSTASVSFALVATGAAYIRLGRDLAKL